MVTVTARTVTVAGRFCRVYHQRGVVFGELVHSRSPALLTSPPGCGRMTPNDPLVPPPLMPVSSTHMYRVCPHPRMLPLPNRVVKIAIPNPTTSEPISSPVKEARGSNGFRFLPTFFIATPPRPYPHIENRWYRQTMASIFDIRKTLRSEPPHTPSAAPGTPRPPPTPPSGSPPPASSRTRGTPRSRRAPPPSPRRPD